MTARVHLTSERTWIRRLAIRFLFGAGFIADNVQRLGRDALSDYKTDLSQRNAHSECDCKLKRFPGVVIDRHRYAAFVRAWTAAFVIAPRQEAMACKYLGANYHGPCHFCDLFTLLMALPILNLCVHGTEQITNNAFQSRAMVAA